MLVGKSPANRSYRNVRVERINDMKIIEVSIRDVNSDEYIYWVDLGKMPDDSDEIDWSIERALKYHAEHVGTEPAEEDEDDLHITGMPPVTAYDPFDRSEGEYTMVP